MERSRRRADGPPSVADDVQVTLPQGVSPADWALEKKAVQNPRIRAYLGSIRLLDDIQESDYSILHCSAERLLEIWRKVHEVSSVIETRIRPLLAVPSKIPRLELARHNAQTSLEALSRDALVELHRVEDEGYARDLAEIRKALCACIGKIHAFLKDTFGALMANDPRSRHDADYFLSQRFPKEIEEAEWLHASVERLSRYLQHLEQDRRSVLSPLLAMLARERTVPVGSLWGGAASFLDELMTVLTPKVREVLALRGIRFDEMKTLDHHASQIPACSATALVLHDAGRRAIEGMKGTPRGHRPEREQAVRDLLEVHASVAVEIHRTLEQVDACLQDLVGFTPAWLEALGRRRALMFRDSMGTAKVGAARLRARRGDTSTGLPPVIP